MSYTFDFENPPTYTDIVEGLKTHYLAKDPLLTSEEIAEGTPLLNIIETQANIEFNNISNSILQTNVALGICSDVFLDAYILNNYGLKRRPQQNGQVNIKVYGQPGTEIPAGFEIRGDETVVFRLLQAVTIPDVGHITVLFTAIDFNTIKYKANTITSIITITNGIDRVEQPHDSIPGTLAESDYAFDKRAKLWGSKSNNSSFASIMNGLLDTPGVLKCNGYENASHESKKIDEGGVTVVSHSVAFVVHGGNDVDIATLISQKKPPGTAMNGDQSIPLTINTKTINYKFYRPTPVPLKFKIQVHLQKGYPNNYEEVIKDRIIQFVDAQDINATIQYTELLCSLNQIRQLFSYELIQLTKKSVNQLQQKNIKLTFLEMATVSPDDITITSV